MNGEQLRSQLETILDAAFRLERLSVAEWQARAGNGKLTGQASAESGGTLYFPLINEGNVVTALSTEAGLITDSERRLVELVIEASKPYEKKPARKTDNDAFITTVRDWIEERPLGGMQDDQEPPPSLTGHPALYTTKIPFLMYGENTRSKNDDYAELKKLLETFFDGEIQLVPLKDKEWLILGNESLLSDWDDDLEANESTEDRLSSLCLGLHSVISTEGAGECHVSVYYPIVPAKTLPSTVMKLREAISTGRLQRVGQYIHLPWELYLDQLLSPLPHADRIRFIEQVFKRPDPLLDAETIQTLETFFELDCNVSETAKKLYIHRNTLLYRLDKFKQESGLDVRTFNQAVHVKIALQLYKVTKRL